MSRFTAAIPSLLFVVMLFFWGYAAGFTIATLSNPKIAAKIESELTPLSEGQTPREHYTGLPPPEFRGEWTGSVRFVDDVKKICGDDAYACASPVGMILPNPCKPDYFAVVGWSARTGALAMMVNGSGWLEEEYRTTVCHELGHANGWPGNHWIATETEIAAIRLEMIEELYEDDQTQGGVERKWLVRSSGEKGEAAIAAMVVDDDVTVSVFENRGEVVRLSPCKYWSMRQEREGDGAAKLKDWGCE
jgi:hypothetical protein